MVFFIKVSSLESCRIVSITWLAAPRVCWRDCPPSAPLGPPGAPPGAPGSTPSTGGADVAQDRLGNVEKKKWFTFGKKPKKKKKEARWPEALDKIHNVPEEVWDMLRQILQGINDL